jgi:hypothetical protein
MNDNPRPFRFESPRQERIHRRLELVGPGPAAFWVDACRMMAEGSLQTTTHMVAHALREIEGSLRAVLLPPDYQPPKPRKGEDPDRHGPQIEAIAKAYGLVDSPAIAVWLKLADRNSELSLPRRAHRDALAAPRALDDTARGLFSDIEALFEALLGKFEEAFLGPFEIIEGLLKKENPGPEDARTLRNRVPNNFITHGHFFDRVENPKWLEPLAAEGFFRQPPAPIREGDTIRFPPWPASRYLVRMAKVSDLQARVADITTAIPDSENVNVSQDLAEVCLSLPARLSAPLVARAGRWLEARARSLLPKKLGEIAAKIAAEGEVDTALQLMETLLAPSRADSSSTEDRPRRQPFDTWLYRDVLKTCAPALTDLGGLEILSMFCRLLAAAAAPSESESADDRDDHSYIWRPAIEGHEQNRGDGEIRDLLVTAARDAAERLVEQDSRSLHAVVETLETQRWNVFRRIVRHVLRRFAATAPDLVAERLMDLEAVEGPELWHEHWLLMREQFPSLSPEQRGTILASIEKGPDLPSYAAWREKMEGSPPNADDLAHRKKVWQLRRLTMLAGVLPPDWEERLQLLRTELGEVEHPDFMSYTSAVWTGPRSPKPVDELRSMPVTELISYLTDWQPSDTFIMGPSPEGLGRELTTMVAADPERFAREAPAFRHVSPTYVRAVLSGLREASKAGKRFEWEPTLDLCQWVVNQDREAADGGGRYEDRDPGWGWSRAAIADLLASGFQEGPNEIPFELRNAAWDTLRPLTQDPEPTPHYEARYGGKNLDPANLSINTVRGEAMHAAIRYGLWVRRHTKDQQDTDAAPQTFSEMPELRTVLDERLHPDREPSQTIRAVFGWWLPWIALLDRGWVAVNLARMFPSDPEQRHLLNASWDTYVTMCQPFNDVLPLLQGEYLRAIERIGSDRQVRQNERPDESLAEHLMVFYLRGRLELDGPELAAFLATAPDALRARAMAFVGRVFRNEDGLPNEFVSRAQLLWNRRMAVARAAPRAHASELEAFGWWFGSGRFDTLWSTTQLRDALALVGRSEPDHLVLERLVAISEELPDACVECVRMLIEGAKEQWTVLMWRDELRSILEATIKSTSTQAQDATRRVINLLAARGYTEFRDILPAE